MCNQLPVPMVVYLIFLYEYFILIRGILNRKNSDPNLVCFLLISSSEKKEEI